MTTPTPAVSTRRRRWSWRGTIAATDSAVSSGSPSGASLMSRDVARTRTMFRDCRSIGRRYRQVPLARELPRSKSSEGSQMMATPVYARRRSFTGTTRRPCAGSTTRIPLRVVRSNTTKWLNSQCRIDPRGRCRRSPTSACTPRARSPYARAAFTMDSAVTPSRPAPAPAGERDGEPARARQVRAGHGRQQRGDRPAAAVDDRGARGALAGADHPHAGYGDDHEDERHPVSPVDPPGTEADHTARGVAAADTELQRLPPEDRLRVGRGGRRAAHQLQGRPGSLHGAGIMSCWCGGRAGRGPPRPPGPGRGQAGPPPPAP